MCKLIFTSPLRTVLLAAASVKLTCVFALSVFQLCVLIINVITARCRLRLLSGEHRVGDHSETLVTINLTSVKSEISVMGFVWASAALRGSEL